MAKPFHGGLFFGGGFAAAALSGFFGGALFDGGFLDGEIVPPTPVPEVRFPASGAGGGTTRPVPSRNQYADRIKAQNAMILNLVAAIVTSDMLE